jgi:hypothetical protein
MLAILRGANGRRHDVDFPGSRGTPNPHRVHKLGMHWLDIVVSRSLVALEVIASVC